MNELVINVQVILDRDLVVLHDFLCGITKDKIDIIPII